MLIPKCQWGNSFPFSQIAGDATQVASSSPCIDGRPCVQVCANACTDPSNHFADDSIPPSVGVLSAITAVSRQTDLVIEAETVGDQAQNVGHVALEPLVPRQRRSVLFHHHIRLVLQIKQRNLETTEKATGSVYVDPERSIPIVGHNE